MEKAVKRPLLGIWYNDDGREDDGLAAVKRPLLGIWYNPMHAEIEAARAVKRPLLGIWYNRDTISALLIIG